MILSAITAIIKQHSPYSHFVFQFYKYSISWWCIFSTCLFSGWESVPCNEPEVCSSVGQDGQRDAGPLTPALLWQSPPKVVLWGENIMVFYLETIYIQDQYPEEGYGWINLQNVFFFLYVCLALKGAQRKKLLCFLLVVNFAHFLCQLDLMAQ